MGERGGRRWVKQFLQKWPYAVCFFTHIYSTPKSKSLVLYLSSKTSGSSILNPKQFCKYPRGRESSSQLGTNTICCVVAGGGGRQWWNHSTFRLHIKIIQRSLNNPCARYIDFQRFTIRRSRANLIRIQLPLHFHSVLIYYYFTFKISLAALIIIKRLPVGLCPTLG